MFFYFLVRGTYRGHVSSLPDLSNSSTKTFMVKEQHKSTHSYVHARTNIKLNKRYASERKKVMCNYVCNFGNPIDKTKNQSKIKKDEIIRLVRRRYCNK